MNMWLPMRVYTVIHKGEKYNVFAFSKADARERAERLYNSEHDVDESKEDDQE